MPTERTQWTRLRTLISNELGVEPQRVTFEARIQEDLGADSLDLVELTMAIEEEFIGGRHITIADEEANAWRTVKDMMDTVQRMTEET